MSEPSKPLSLPRSVTLLFGRVAASLRALSRPARVLLGTTTALALLFGGFVVLQKANESYSPLFSQLEREDAATIVAKLKELKVAYRVDADGTTIEVPESQARELRLELAGSGLPRGGGVGFESFDKMRMGATDFEQRVLYRRALEGELTRTIGTLGAVESARVHLVLPEKSVFISRGEPASGSIILRLRRGRSLGPAEVGGVVHLVASAVPGLDADRITVVTTEGAMLHRPRKPGSSAGADDDAVAEEDGRGAAKSYESTIEERVRAMLERVVGPGHADVRVTAEMDSARVERVEEHYDPARAVLRSEEQSVEHGPAEQDLSVAGVPGAESNLPTGASNVLKAATPAKPAGSAPAAGALPLASATAVAPGSVRESHTRNYEIDHVSEKRTIASGALKRLAVAVVLDGANGARGDKGLVPRPREELDRIAQLVHSAAGVSESRGDVVTVESMLFADPIESPADPVTQPPGTLARSPAVRRWAPFAIGATLLIALGGVALKRRHAVRAPSAESQLPPSPIPLSLETGMRPVVDSADLRSRAHSRATQDPATAALVLRFWLGTETPEGAREAASS